MKNFNRGGGFSDRKSGSGFGQRDSGGRDSSRGGGSYRGGDSFSRPAMHKATCAQCGQTCEVPFKPSGDKPVYCSNCFKGKDGLNSQRSGGRDSSRGGSSYRGSDSFSRPAMHKATCAQCGQSCEVPFQPLAGKPVYCSKCFGRGDSGNSSSNSTSNSNSNNGSSKEQFEILNAKLDKILRALGPISSGEPTIKREADKKVKKSEKIFTPKLAAIKVAATEKRLIVKKRKRSDK